MAVTNLTLTDPSGIKAGILKNVRFCFGSGSPVSDPNLSGPDFPSGSMYADVTGNVIYVMNTSNVWVASTGAQGEGYSATSTSSVAIGTGTKTFTTQAGLAYLPGDRVRISDSSDTTKYMEGVVTSYSGTTLVISSDLAVSSGTITTWNIGIAGNPGVVAINRNTTPSAIDTTGTASAAAMASGYITSTSAAAVSITTPTAAAIIAQLGGSAGKGTSYELVVDNSAGANTVTLVLDGSITVLNSNSLAVTTANAVGIFKIIFTGATTAVIARIQ